QRHADRDHHDRGLAGRSAARPAARRQRVHHQADSGASGDRDGQRTPQDRMNAPRPWIKICGVTTPEDAELVVAAGADALGVNLVPRSKRAVDLPTAQTIAKAVRGKIELIGVVADRELEAVDALRRELGLDWLQLHGNEPPGMVARLQRAYKAIGISMPEDVTRARACPGERLLVDRKVGEREQLAG